MGSWQVFPRRLLIERSDRSEKVTPKVMDVLVYLASRPGEVVTKDELMEAAWPGVYVSDGAIRRTISHLRDALDDDAQTPRYIETVATVGYRLIAPVQPLSGESTMRSSPSHEEAATASGAAIGGCDGRILRCLCCLSGERRASGCSGRHLTLLLRLRPGSFP